MRSSAVWNVGLVVMGLVAVAPRFGQAETVEGTVDVRTTHRGKLASGPEARRDGGQIIIRFEVDAPTDVEAAILDADGKVVRHLAAGLLGKNAPEPFRKNSLGQEIGWDGLDDAGNADSAGPNNTISQPEIPFAWPTVCDYAEADGKLYVTDSVNRRIVVVRFEYAAEGEAPLP